MVKNNIEVKCKNYKVCKNKVVMQESVVSGVKKRGGKILCIDCKKKAQSERVKTSRELKQKYPWLNKQEHQNKSLMDSR
jgi:hypothetical protein